MAYKIIYIEDLDPGSIIHDLKRFGFETIHHVPKVFEDAIKAITDFDLLLIDFRLNQSTAMFDAPTIAQNLRTYNSTTHKDIPIILISQEGNITDYYNDLTSKDLFDMAITKTALSEDLEKFTKRFKSLIQAYKKIREVKFDPSLALSVRKEQVDYRIFEKLENDIMRNDVFAFSNFVLKDIIRTIGVLIGEDVLAARLGVDRNSTDWEKLKLQFQAFKYDGIHSDAYDRWWANELINWWKTTIDNSISLRSLNAEQRVSKLTKQFNFQLRPLQKSEYAQSSNFWTICKETDLPIDPIDGLEIHKKDLLPWQEKEYISIYAGLNPKSYDSSGPIYTRYLKPIDKKRLREIERGGRNG